MSWNFDFKTDLQKHMSFCIYIYANVQQYLQKMCMHVTRCQNRFFMFLFQGRNKISAVDKLLFDR